MIRPDDQPAPSPAPHREDPAGASVATQPRRLRVALVHDWLVGFRGGEAVLEAIARALIARGDEIVGVYCMFDARGPIGPAIDSLSRRASWVNTLPGALRLRRWLLPLYPLSVRDLSRRIQQDHRRRAIDVVVSTSSAGAKGVRPPKGVPHVCYCHTPARYLWSQASEYASGAGGGLRRLGLGLLGGALRRWDRATARNVGEFIANSSHTRALISRCYGRSSRIVHPPVRTDFFAPDDAVRRRGWLCVGAMEPYKRFDLAIRAAVLANAPLTIVGTGSQETSLRTLARRIESDGRLITFAGRLDDQALADAYRRAELLLFPQIEDFGIVAAEAQACGTPVIARNAGGALDIVVPESTGVLVDSDSHIELAQAARRWTAFAATREREIARACRENAERFAAERFEREILERIDAAVDHR